MLKNYFLLVTAFLLGTVSMLAQFENPSNTVRFENDVTTDVESPSGFELPARETPSLTKEKSPYSSVIDPNMGENKPASVDITQGDGLLDYKTDTAPKYFATDNEATEEFGRDQYLGDFKTSRNQVTIAYRDHQSVDGDRVRIFINGDVVRANVGLSGSYQGFSIPLQAGFNRIDFQALNQGDSGPNTAELKVFDVDGKLLASHEWNLLTGNTATIIVVKD